MDSFAAMMKGIANQGNPVRVFDWRSAAEIIRDRKPKVAAAGLQDDWEYTGGDIYRDGAPVPAKDTYTYLASNWAIPELVIDGQIMECWVWESETKWDEHTYWPKEALEVLNSEVK